MKPGHGEILLAEGDPQVREEEERLIEEFRRQLDEGMWAAVPTTNPGSGRREGIRRPAPMNAAITNHSANPTKKTVSTICRRETSV